MRSDAILLLAASMTMGCLDDRAPAIDPIPDGAVPVPSPDGAPPQIPPADEEPAPADACADDAATPTRAPEPTPGWCRALYLDPEDAILKRVERTLSTARDRRTETVEAFDGAGAATYRTVARTVDGAEVFQSVEHLHLAPEASLPNTFGQPATFSVTTTRDDAGRALRVQTDVALDGVIEREEHFVYRDGVLVESRSLSDGELQTHRTFSASGRPLRDGLGEDGRRWFYDDDGLLIRDALFVGGRLVRWTDWVEAAPDVPLESTTHQRVHHQDGSTTDRRITMARWTRRDDGVLFEQTRVVSDAVGVRTTSIETDADGREVRFVESDSGAGGQTFVRESTWHGELLVRQRSTVDGAPLESFDATLDAEGRVTEKRWLNTSNGGRSERVSQWVYGPCGAVVRHARWWNGQRIHLEVSTVDDTGRVTRRAVTDREGDTRVTASVWDAAGRLVEHGGTSFDFDGAGRLTRVTYGDDAGGLFPIGGRGDAYLPPTRRIEYSYDCGG